MKFLITESKKEKLIIDWLDKNYSDLTMVYNSSNHLVYVDNKNDTIFHYSKFFNLITITDQSLIKMLSSVFDLEESSLRHIFIPWFKRHYKTNIVDVEYPYNYKTL